ncbi:IS66 family transposase [Segatella bryantii]|uniref:IS66 family transposase n=1 Tax=Segatella bryantii TaxID=77095 RepID=UPI00242DA548|nr:transposase [Segatella bryantii]
MLKITPGTRIKMPCCNCERVQEMEVTNVIPRINEIIVKQGPNIVTANIAVGRAKCCNCGQYNEVNPADFVPIDRFEDPTAKVGTTIINQGTVISSSKPGQNPVVTQFEETTKNLEKQLDKHKEVLKPSQNSVRTQTQVSRREDAKSITNADTLIKSSIRFEDYLITNKYGDLVISPIIMNYCDGSDLPLFKKGKASEGVAIDMCAMNSILTVPKSRIAKFMEGCGCTFTPQNVINIINGFSRAFCAPIAKEILKDLLTKNKAAIMDETPLPVRENKKVTGHDSYIWAVHNGHTETIKASYFWFGDGRDSSNVTNIIESICKDDFNIDSLLADGFTGYDAALKVLSDNGINIKGCRCFSHARRPLHYLLKEQGLLKIYNEQLLPAKAKFSDFEENLRKYRATKDGKRLSEKNVSLLTIYWMINALFVVDSAVVRKHCFVCNTAEFKADLMKERKAKSAKIVDSLFDSIRMFIAANPKIMNCTLTKNGDYRFTQNKLYPESRALIYLLKFEKDLRCFTESADIELTSNAAERSLKLGICTRNNCMFIHSVDGAHAFADYRTITNTCNQNRVPVQHYLIWLVANMKWRINKMIMEGHNNPTYFTMPGKQKKEGGDTLSMYDKENRYGHDKVDVSGLTPYDYRKYLEKSLGI